MALSTKITFPPIIFENNDYLVINKPAGLAVHRGGNLQEKTLADLIIAKYPKIKTVGEDPLRPGLVHRLDKEVSGLMIIAKNQNSFFYFKNLFKNRQINKEYLALAHGKIISDEGKITFSIKRSKDGYKMAAMPFNTFDLLSRRHPSGRDQGNLDGIFKAREALTEYTVTKRFINYTLLQIKISTGRTHQIRVHFFALGHPLVGDNLYSTKKTKIKNEKINLQRVFLYANQLAFKDPAGEKKEFHLEIPTTLNNFLQTLK